MSAPDNTGWCLRTYLVVTTGDWRGKGEASSWILWVQDRDAHKSPSAFRTAPETEYPDQRSPIWRLGNAVRCVLVVFQLLSHVQLLATPWTAAARLPCPSPSPGVCSNSCPLSRWSVLIVIQLNNKRQIPLILESWGGEKSYLCVRARFVEAAEVTQACMLFSPWSKRYQIAMMQIHSWVQWKILDKASFSLARQCNGCFPSHRYKEEWRSRCLLGFLCTLPQDAWDKRAGSWLRWFNRLKRRSRNFSPNNCSLFSKIDRVCLSLIHLRVIRRSGGAEAEAETERLCQASGRGWCGWGETLVKQTWRQLSLCPHPVSSYPSVASTSTPPQRLALPHSLTDELRTKACTRERGHFFPLELTATQILDSTPPRS